MKYLEDEKLNQLTSELTDASLGDSRVINGRIEAFIMKRAGTDKKYAHALGERYVAEMELAENQLATYQQLQEHLRQHAAGRKRSQSAGGILEALYHPPGKLQRSEETRVQSTGGLLESFHQVKHQRAEAKDTIPPHKRPRAASFDSAKSADSAKLLSSSALGDLQAMSTRRLMTDLILTLNASFPDYDFGSVRAKDFKTVPIEQVMRRANDRLSVFASHKEGFLAKLWESIDQVISLQDAHVYTFVPPRDELSFLTQTLVDDDSATPLWSFNYFFVNKQMKRILLFCCVETMLTSPSGDESEFITKSVEYNERQNNESNFDLDPAADVAGGIPVETMM
jgi:hypothetical protein